ncbi:MAG: hypothetical protein A2504_12870 [Bdellovibrionales bacterium RIFOXYD12_FULL_39_22]|nr:MAG: hypothetical protein A2385_03955 [Bdellovibrionales bacterium RIFOXYB1_FULL_39_21]OFZ40507.1 MAG: hypothetical protein A2485_02820 [Bdellovibrionales bacterium RIFOXYC12_FULL_39_17]OFZ49990.1 MAG: hypothetical protein A2404_02155 [Bdellovibrionales bacterium RIFOXYC1_FULL_39_130]OFZ69895.1 MAG: hypothetical protein A2451_01240 [Bdellovibrionales bacterium RIFOXYC2_FULL_39_8]OFZ77632.1 MAG: hypothetical protein A2560_04715 [Bdellovibrionales bacterium RIFOXYD1_FULL_39_84]OFZ96086.1 MAG:
MRDYIKKMAFRVIVISCLFLIWPTLILAETVSALSTENPIKISGVIDGVSLDSPLNLVWPMDNMAENRAELIEYFRRLKQLNIKAIRKLVPGKLIDSPTCGEQLIEFVEIAAQHRIKLFFYIGFKMPSDLGIMEKENNMQAYQALIQAGENNIDKTIGYISRNGSKFDSTIIGYSIGNGENLRNIANMDFVREMIIYSQQIDPSHRYTTELKANRNGMFNGQLLGLGTASGKPYDEALEQRSVYDVLDFIAFANYTGLSNTAEISFKDTLSLIAKQNPRNLDVVVEEYGTKLENEVSRAKYLRSIRETIATSTEVNIIAAFLWDAHVNWHTLFRPLNPNINYGLFEYDTSVPYKIGATRPSILATFNSSPELGQRISGVSTPKRLASTLYAISTSDVNNNQTHCGWDFDGDHKVDQWSKVNAQKACWVLHKFTSKGEQTVRVLVIDSLKSFSRWVSKTVNVVL